MRSFEYVAEGRHVDDVGNLIGGPGVDTADYSGAAARGVNNSLGTGAVWSDADRWPDDAVGDTLSSIENLVATSSTTGWPETPATTGSRTGAETTAVRRDRRGTLLGGEGHDYLFGGRGNDVLYGGVDADCLFGDAGDDVLYSGNGPDHIDGGAGSHTVTLAGAAAGVTVRLGATDVRAGYDTIETVEVVIGSDGDDTLSGGFGGLEQAVARLHEMADRAVGLQRAD